MTKFSHSKTAQEAAAIITEITGRDISARQVTRYGANGAIDAIKLPGRTGSWVFNEASVRTFAAKRAAQLVTN